jgi:hypothetical protein
MSRLPRREASHGVNSCPGRHTRHAHGARCRSPRRRRANRSARSWRQTGPASPRPGEGGGEEGGGTRHHDTMTARQGKAIVPVHMHCINLIVSCVVPADVIAVETRVTSRGGCLRSSSAADTGTSPMQVNHTPYHWNGNISLTIKTI